VRELESATERKVTYFTYCGEVNTDRVLEAARSRCADSELSKIVIASETGRSARKALDVFRGINIEMIVVTHYPAVTSGPKGKIPIGIKRKEYAETLKTLIDAGAKIVQGTVPFAPPSRSINWHYPTPEGIIDKTLEIFGAGTKVAIQAAIMATDAGEVNENEQVVTCAGTYKGLDTALVVKAAYSMNFFKEFEVKEIIAKPICRVKTLPGNKYENWKGNLDAYYAT